MNDVSNSQRPKNRSNTNGPASRRPASGGGLVELDTLRDLYLSERQRRNMVRSRVGIPVTIIAFMTYGYVTYASSFEVERWGDPLTVAIVGLQAASLMLLLISMVSLTLVEWHYLRRGLPVFEDPVHARDEKEFLRGAYSVMRETNEKAERHRAKSFLFLMAAIAFFLVAVALLPLHIQA